MKKPVSPVSIRRRHMTLGLAAGAAGAFAWTPALAQHFPAKPVRIVCAFPPGNASDVVARIIAE